MLFEFLFLAMIVIYLFHKHTSKNYDYWKKRGFPYMKPKPFFGNFLEVVLRKYGMGHHFLNLYKRNNSPYFGIFLFSRPALIVKDIEILKNILIKDFNCFTDRSIFTSERDPIAAYMMFNDKGESWRTMRSKLMPFFTPKNLKNMLNHIDNLAVKMQNYIEKHQDEPFLEAKELCCKFSTDVIAKCALAIDANSFDLDGEFRNASRKIFDQRLITSFRHLCYFFFHSGVKIFNLKLIDPTVTKFFRKVFWESIRIREEQNIQGHDLLDIIVELRKDKEFCKAFKFEGDKVISQPYMFFAAGFETVASTISFSLYELCVHPEKQKKLKENMREIYKEYGKVNYDCLAKMKYLNMVIKETLRKYPALPFIDRVCTNEYEIPGTKNIIEKGMIVIAPMLGLHYDPKYYDEPETFLPERFETDRRDYPYLPFGKGPRSCVGERMGLLTVRLAIFRILSAFDVIKSENTPVPLVYNPGSLMLSSTSGLPMKFKRCESFI